MKYLWFWFGFATLLLTSCFQDANLPNVSNIDIEVDIERFDKALMELDTNNLVSDYPVLVSKYPNITNLLFSQIIPIQQTEEMNLDTLRDFLTNAYVRKSMEETSKLFPSLKKQEKELNKALQYYLYYFPNADIPSFYSGITDYTYQSFIFDDGKTDGICSSLDLYLGRDYDYKSIDAKNPAFSNYISRRYDEVYMTKKMIELLVEEQTGALQGKRMLDHMIYNGKKWFLLKKLLPTAHDSIITEFTSRQLNWCNQSELAMWSYILDNNLMYETNQQKIKTYVFESPSSYGMPKEAPGRTAQYLGWKIVTKYMEESNSTIEELIREKDNTKILKNSKYKPKRT